jgi:hypothetical protein
MASQSVLFKTPLKGVMKNPAFNDSPLDAAVDAVNVLPWDRTGRFRINQRAGTSKLYGAALVAAQPVQALIQTTLALDPASIVANTPVTNETFTYSNGTLGTVSSAVWTEGSIAGMGGSTGVTVASNQVQNALTSAARGARLTASPVLGTAYVIKMQATFASLVNTHQVAIVFRLDTSNPVTTGWTLTVTSNGGTGGGTIQFLKNGVNFSTVNLATGALVAGSAFTLEARINGNLFTGWINGSKLISTNADSTFSAFSGNGFYYGTGSNGTPNTFTIDNFQSFTGTAPATLRQTNIVAVCSGSVFVGTNAAIAQATGGGSVLSNTTVPGIAYSAGLVYMVDGFTVQTLNLTTSTVTATVATAGTLPSLCTLATVWRDRLVLAAPRGTPQNFFFSRVGTATDFDFSQVDTAAAFAGNASTAGHIGEPIVALIPFSDDKLLIAGDHNMWMVSGDPADGGSIDLISDAIGILGPNSWTKAPDGTIYFVGTGGFYRMAAGSGVPENISNKAYNEFFRSINRGGYYVTMAYDRDQQGAFVFVSPVNTGTATHLWWDARTEAFWPIQYPNSHGPICSLVYDGDGPTDRVLLMGGRTGFVQQMSLTAKDDDGTAISSFIYLGPVKASNINDSVIEAVDLVFGEPPPGFVEADWNVDVQVVAAPTIEKAFTAPLYTRKRNFTASRRPPRWTQRTRGNAFFLKLSNSTIGKTWSLESAQAQMMNAGLTRRR